MFRCLCVALVLFAAVNSSRADAPLPVVASFSILGDIVKNVGGDRVKVETLIGPNGDAHSYAPKPTDVKKLAAAKLIFINGIGFESWLGRLIDHNAAKDRIVIASRGVAARKLPNGASDPHAWLSAANVRFYVATIRDALGEADPAGKDLYRAQADAYLKDIDALDGEIRASFAAIPESKKRVVTAHPSFGYFGAAYGLAFSSLQNIGHDAEPSAKSVAGFIDLIRREKIAALFVEAGGEPRLMQRIAAETGTKVGGALYSDALSERSGPAPTYITMMRQNVRTIGAALRD